MIYLTKPNNFNSSFDVVSCFVQCEDEFLMLLRQDAKPEGNKWGVPAGKVDEGETNLISLMRELWEETGLKKLPDDFSFSTELYVSYPDYNFVFQMYSISLMEKPPVVLRSKEHKDYSWVSPLDSLKLPLVRDMKQCIEIFYDL